MDIVAYNYINVREVEWTESSSLLPTILCVGMSCCEKYGMLIGFFVALKCFVGSNLSCICNL